MYGEKISAARSSLLQFVDLLDDRDRLEIMLFSKELVTLTPLTALGEKRNEVRTRVSGIVEQGDTRLYGAVVAAYNELLENGDPDHIRAMVVLSDGENTVWDVDLDQVVAQIGGSSESGKAPKIFTIAFGDDADRDVLRRIAEITGGKQYDGDPQTIYEVYAIIATFF
jgi:Ca-activated chloride channel family protein